jgi:hypothetical protein
MGGISAPVFVDTAINLVHNSNAVIDKLFNEDDTALGYFLCILNAKKRSKAVSGLLRSFTTTIWAQTLLADYDVFIPTLRYQTFLKGVKKK